MKFYVAKIIYYNEYEEDMNTEYICAAGENFTETMKAIEEYYGEDLDTVELEEINDERPIVILPNYATYEVIRKEGKV